MNYILVICTLAVGHSLFAAVALLILHKKPSNRLLALLLFLLALRIGKSVVGFFFSHMIYGLSIVGVISMAAIGPVLLLLIQSLFVTVKPMSRKAYVHFLPALFLLAVLPWNTSWKILSPAYFVITWQVLLYIALSYYYVWYNREAFRADDLKWKWSLNLLVGITILWLTFILQITVYQPFIYATNVITAAIVFYTLSLWAMKRARIFLAEPKSKPDQADVYEQLGKRIEQLLISEEAYRDPNLTVSALAAKLKSPPYLVSKAINHFFKKSFSELLLHYRIKKSEQLLLSPESKTYTIEAIAYESGFNTLSAFYAAFKKMNKTTPAQYRHGKGLSNLKIA
jgi:AraC-like DNA-binding protein